MELYLHARCYPVSKPPIWERDGITKKNAPTFDLNPCCDAVIHRSSIVKSHTVYIDDLTSRAYHLTA